MKSTIDDSINLGEPHFDEEATILAARPVVPLDEVKETKRSKGGRALALAIGGGLIIGLLAAMLIFRYLSVGQPPVETTSAEAPTQVAEQPVGQLPTSGGGAASIDAPKPSEQENPPVASNDDRQTEPQIDEPRTVRTPDRSSEVERRPVIVTDAPRPADDGEDEEVDRAARRAERQEARRERRRAAREAKRQDRQQPPTSDDLTRIREIFEGTPRP